MRGILATLSLKFVLNIGETNISISIAAFFSYRWSVIMGLIVYTRVTTLNFNSIYLSFSLADSGYANTQSRIYYK